MLWLDRKVIFGRRVEGDGRDMYIFHEGPRQCIVTRELIPHRSGHEGCVLYIGGTSAHEMG